MNYDSQANVSEGRQGEDASKESSRAKESGKGALDLTPRQIAKFWSRVNINGRTLRPDLTPCWEWTGGVQNKGYGQLSFRKKHYLAHRISWAIHAGVMPSKHVLHHCDNPVCVNPAHLWLGTQQENVQDMVSKRRQAPYSITAGAIPIERRQFGSQHNCSKLTESKVIEIRQLLGSGLFNKTILAARFGVSRALIRYATNGKGWKHVPFSQEPEAEPASDLIRQQFEQMKAANAKMRGGQA